MRNDALSLSLADQRRQKLFAFIEHLVRWENSTGERILTTARELILAATEGNPPPVLDPFCGGGSIPLEAQRLGLEAHASDLNPVAVLITKALIEIPPKFANRPPVNPENRTQELGDRDALPRVDGVAEGDGGRYSLFSQTWKGVAGLAADVRFYGRWMRDEADKQIGHLYPKAKLPDGKEATVIAWLWARTVTCPNPVCSAQMPLASKFWLSTKKGKEAWVEPIVDRATKTVRFEVRTGTLTKGEAERVSVGTGFTGDRGKKIKATFRCVVCGDGVAKGDYLDSEAGAGRMGVMPLAIVAEGPSGRVYLSFNDEHTRIAIDEARAFLEDPSVREQLPTEPARGTFASNAQGRIYGFKTFADYFTPRQLVALTTFSDLVAVTAGLPDDGVSLDDGGTGATASADAVATYLAFAIGRMADSLCSLATWQSVGDFVAHAFARQALPMVWDYAEVNPFSHSTRNFADAVEWTVEVCASLPASSPAFAVQTDAREVESARGARMKILATDPPYYDNIGYADLSDFFYVWLRRSLGSVYPQLFGTLLTPKTQELIASPYRFGGNTDEARAFFEVRPTRRWRWERSSGSRHRPLNAGGPFACRGAPTSETSPPWSRAHHGSAAVVSPLLSHVGFAYSRPRAATGTHTDLPTNHLLYLPIPYLQIPVNSLLTPRSAMRLYAKPASVKKPRSLRRKMPNARAWKGQSRRESDASTSAVVAPLAI